jgi:phage gpG-like protein
MPMTVQFDDAEVQRVLQAAANMAQYPEALMGTVSNVMLRETQRTFREQAFDGSPWAPLAESMQQARWPGEVAGRRGGPRKPVNKRRGTQSILHPTGKHLLQTLHQSHTDNESRVGTPTFWAFVHNFGAPLQHFTMPRRTFLGFSRRLVEDIGKAAQSYLERGLKAALR